jgi:TRAP-type uncharacterized transport system fused permease subunit
MKLHLTLYQVATRLQNSLPYLLPVTFLMYLLFFWPTSTVKQQILSPVTLTMITVFFLLANKLLDVFINRSKNNSSDTDGKHLV